ncbi:hypothetical protein [Sinorhizobium fredii]|uniref:hypothetical protein n=1 Tax=Rhizobium fredii TaxID=380 RepID=UPI003BB5DA2C
MDGGAGLDQLNGGAGADKLDGGLIPTPRLIQGHPPGSRLVLQTSLLTAAMPKVTFIYRSKD